MVTHCHSLSLVVPLVVIPCHLLYHSFSLDVPIVCLFINDHENEYIKQPLIAIEAFFTPFIS